MLYSSMHAKSHMWTIGCIPDAIARHLLYKEDATSKPADV